MSFLFPAFLLGALAIAIPIILHLMRRERAPVVPFSAVRFVRRSTTLRTRRLRLRELLLLALRVAALLLLTLAFARPFIDDRAPEPLVTVVAIDRSLSMSAPGQMERARALAAAAVDAAPSGHRVAVVAFDDRAVVVLEAAADRAAAAAAVASVTATAGATRYEAALSAASGLLGPRGGRIVIVTDLQEAGWSDGGGAEVPVDAVVEMAVVDPVRANLAVTGAARTADGIAARVSNSGEDPRDALVLLTVDDAVVESRVETLGPGATALRFERALPETGVVAVQVVDTDGYDGDNRRYLLLDPLPRAHVLAVANDGPGGSEAFFLDRALAAGDESASFALRVSAPEAVAALDAAVWERMAAVVVLGTQGLGEAGRERLSAFLEAGGGLLVAMGPGVESAPVARIIGLDARLVLEPGPGAVTRRWLGTDRRHPVLRALGAGASGLGEAIFRGAATIAEDGGARVLGRFDDGSPALVEHEVDGGRVLLFASDLAGAWNDFPRRPGFAPFVHETVRYVARRSFPPREVTVADAPHSGALPGAAIVPGSERRIVVNPDPRESDPAPTTAEAFLALVEHRERRVGGLRTDEGAAARRERDQSYWWYALAAMLAVLVGEAWLARTMA